MTDSTLLNKEVVETLASNPTYKKFKFLAPARRLALTASRGRRARPGCPSCGNARSSTSRQHSSTPYWPAYRVPTSVRSSASRWSWV